MRTTKKNNTKANTKLRKAADNLDHAAIVADYAEGALSLSEIATKYNTTQNNVGLIANRFWKKLTNMKESRALIQITDAQDPNAHFDAKNSLKELHGTDLINTDFLALLSEPDAALLTDQEATYCWLIVHSGDLREALKMANLDVGLHRDKMRDTRFSYDRALVLRSTYLNAKPNIAAYIKELRETRLIDADVGKAKVQTELVEQLEQMKSAHDPHRHRTQILRTIELLGKSVGAFVDRVEVRQVDPSDALDELIEMAKEATVTEVEPENITESTQ